MNEFTFRSATESDLSAIVEIYNEAILAGGLTADTTTYQVHEKRDWFHNTNTDQYGIYVLLAEEIVIGYFYFSAWRKNRKALETIAEISYYLSSKFHGKGLGHKMLSQSLNIAKEKKFEHLLAILLSSNQRSKNLLLKWDFELIGEMKDIAIIHEKRVGQYIMMRSL